ncbi:MAG: hypothetical protein NTV39_00470 [Candidatus Saccharibacteria bacterium]|nr:hypothetical protein [Candidatus Saccharibacteria bacterium]
MRIINRSINKMLIYVFALLIAVNFPLSAAVGAVDSTPAATPPAAPATTYTYDAATGHWNTNSWYYDATTGTYKAVVQPIAAPPPAVASPAVDPTIVTPQSNAPVSDTQAAATTDTSNQATAANNIGSQATTGNATVLANTAAGSAATGNAASTATILNNVNSTLSTANNQAAASFVSNVMGNVNGDILLQPMILKAVLENGATNPTSSAATITNTNNLTNNVNLGATSGNAGVVGNTSAGNATSGTANTVANVVNIINSLVAANQSFVGTINIYGNLNGDILIAPNFIPQLIASNGGNTSGSSLNSAPTAATITSNNMQNIVNNVSLAAASGKAAVMDNTTAGNATTGNANTNVVIFNLSGHAVVASNSLLVFVNVLGKWVGVIVDAPVGATSAAIGNGVTSNTVVPPNLTIVNNNNNQITNNINLNSLSGNATVAANTLAGNAVTGNATSSANIANISNSQFGLTGWFGVLFINVFGTWDGSFGINTSAGDPINTSSGGSNNRVIEFVPKPSATTSNVKLVSNNGGTGKYSVTETNNKSDPGKVLGGATNNTTKPTGYPTGLTYPAKTLNVALMAGSVFITAVSAAGVRRYVLAGKTRAAV